MSEEQEEVREGGFKPGVGPHLVYMLCAVLTVSFVAWAAFSTLDIVSMATGEVIPSSQVKTVQHLEGGIVSKILVREGEEIKQGQPLIELEPTTSTADVGELKVRLTSLNVQIQELKSRLNHDKVPKFDADTIKDYPNLVREFRRSFEISLRRQASEIEQQKNIVQQRRSAIGEINTRINSRRRNLNLLKEQIKISDDLLKDNLTNRYKHLDLLKEAGKTQGDIEEDQAALVSARSALEEVSAGLQTVQNTFDEENKAALDEARLSYNELTQRMQKFQDSLKRTKLRSPVSGVVKSIHIATIGGVVKPGEPVVDIVPKGDKLIVEAQLQTQDIGFVQAGQNVMVRLASADANRFGGLEGEVISVSPDTLLTPDGVPYYKVRIATDVAYFERGALKYSLFPGMQVIANIHTGTRTIFQYMFDPFLSSMGDAMQER
ncbi:MAG: HlyD family type I secretion periplasmic adaptor subunit [Rhodospirillaceae bacterium]|jgi:adhesin transport system membrane fusion protein|nr:HlyD family type I secretion periplasmic adaptor subunit [Rhodospirillaceae bacterium]MBT3885591.1 HlyD family type I secretion periplasmic adaptor subunit [Rhodospirillaceae bacterium]MBT4116082.1 HlyD family type I secretion periplasmic adaptor subunit [Rhodospirillaceae bacterium]MBT4673999.1 HlyD family type I secretion periplasmic adaptor subunit [Rhodospirillaceae bacterium]MBT4717960.1 HlyD family type I secretion periplasmic adaptor subunit [Rhodospirillaceae bacterium]